jgi:spoIIIJ-associated protein
VIENQAPHSDLAQGESQGIPEPHGDHGGHRDHGEDPAVKDFCDRILRNLEFDLTVEAQLKDDAIFLNLTGPDRPMLLSNAASALNSLEYLLNKVFRTGKGEKIHSITLDCDQYRQHREAELTLLAKMASEKVMVQKKPLTLQPMIPRERRIVHLVLAEIEGVRSESGGEGDNRSITIYPQ